MLENIPAHQGCSNVTSISFTGGDRSCILWDVATGRVIRKINGHSQKINALDMNNDASVLISASYDKTVCCWDLRSNMREPIQVTIYVKPVNACIQFSLVCDHSNR